MIYHFYCSGDHDIYQIGSFVPGILHPLYCYYKWWGGGWGGGGGGDGIGGGELIYNRVWEWGQGVGIIL